MLPTIRVFVLNPAYLHSSRSYNLTMQFHALQHDVIQGDVQGTQLTIESQLTSANLNNGEYVVLQEMTVSGWSMDIHAVSDIGSVEWALGLATQYGVWLQVGWAKRMGDRGLNCVTICSPDGNIVATYEKLYTLSLIHI